MSLSDKIFGTYSDRQIKKINKIDASRKKYYSIFSETEWGDKEGYHLMINTTGINIKEIVDPVADYFRKFKY